MLSGDAPGAQPSCSPVMPSPRLRHAVVALAVIIVAIGTTQRWAARGSPGQAAACHYPSAFDSARDLFDRLKPFEDAKPGWEGLVPGSGLAKLCLAHTPHTRTQARLGIETILR